MALKVSAALAAVVMVASCGDNEVPQGERRSGTRLRARYLVDVEGDRIFDGWFDRTLGVDCAWTAGAAPRCLPAHVATLRFADPACQQPVAFEADLACAPDLTYLSVARDPCDAGVTEVWSIRPESAPLGVTFDLDPVSGACAEHPREPPGFFVLGERRLALEEFVGGAVVAAGRGRVMTRTVVGEDGSLAPEGAVDASLDVACRLDPDARQCLPDAQYASYALDQACQVPLLTGVAACPAPAYVWLPPTGVDGDQAPRLFTGGEFITSDPADILHLFDMRIYVVGEGRSCWPGDRVVTPGYAAYRAGDELAVASLPTVTSEVGTGQRLLPRMRRAGEHVEIVDYVDTVVGAPCRPGELDTGAWWCLPDLHSVWRDFFYADAACTTPLAMMFQYGGVDVPAIEYVESGACTRRVRLYEHGAERPPGTYFWRADGGCQPWDHGGDIEFRAFEVGAEVVPPFAALTAIVE